MIHLGRVFFVMRQSLVAPTWVWVVKLQLKTLLRCLTSSQVWRCWILDVELVGLLSLWPGIKYSNMQKNMNLHNLHQLIWAQFTFTKSSLSAVNGNLLIIEKRICVDQELWCWCSWYWPVHQHDRNSSGLQSWDGASCQTQSTILHWGCSYHGVSRELLWCCLQVSFPSAMKGLI